MSGASDVITFHFHGRNPFGLLEQNLLQKELNAAVVSVLVTNGHSFEKEGAHVKEMKEHVKDLVFGGSASIQVAAGVKIPKCKDKISHMRTTQDDQAANPGVVP